MHTVRAMIEIDEELCDGCGLCIPSCHEGALEIRDGKARLRADHLCDGLGACLGECPRGALKVVQREAAPFVDPHAGQHAHAHAPTPASRAATPSAEPEPCGCPGAALRTFAPLPAIAPPPGPSPDIARRAASGSGPGHWPVKARLVPPHAPFLRDADLLVAADCAPCAMPTFHADLLAGRSVMIGCPKFDDLEEYTARFARVFATSGVRRVTVAVMEVPCCQGLHAAVLRARAAAGSSVPVEVVTVGVDGRTLSRETA